MTLRPPLSIMVLVLSAWLTASCAPNNPTAASPCNDDSECQVSERCLAGRCASSSDRMGALVDGGPLPRDASSAVDAGTEDGGGEREGPDGGLPGDASAPAPDGPEDDAAVDAGVDAGADAGDEDAGPGCEGPDEDGDGIPDACDNCPLLPNPLQEDNFEILFGFEPDGVGDACDPRPTLPGDSIVHFTSFADLEGWTPSGCTWTVEGGDVTQSEGAGAKNCRLVWDGEPEANLVLQTYAEVLSLETSKASVGAMVSVVGNGGWYCNAHETGNLLISRVSSGNATPRGSARLSSAPVGERPFIVGGSAKQALCGTDGDIVYHHVHSGRSNGQVALRTNDARATFRYAIIYRLGGDLEFPVFSTPRHRYAFDDPADSDIVRDSEGGLHGESKGGYSRGPSSIILEPNRTGYVDLPNGIISRLDAVTVETWVTWDGTEEGGGPWQRIFDFGNSSIGEIHDVDDPNDPPDYHGHGVSSWVLTPATETDGLYTRLRDASGEEHFVMSTERLPIGREVHVAVSYDPAVGYAALYVDGGQRTYAIGDMPLSDLDDVNAWIGRSNFDHDKRFDGEVHDFRIYDYALKPHEILSSFQAGPDATF